MSACAWACMATATGEGMASSWGLPQHGDCGPWWSSLLLSPICSGLLAPLAHFQTSAGPSVCD